MIPFYCFRCNKNTSTIDGFRCLNCHSVKESMVPEMKNFKPAKPESRRSSSGCCVSVSDASTQTNEEDFVDYETTRDASTQTDDDDDFPPLELTLDASTQTTYSESSSTDSSSSDCSCQSDCQDSANNVNTLEDDRETRNSDLVLTDSESSCPDQIVPYREYIDESKPINDVKKLNLDSCNRGLSDFSSQSDRQDSSDFINTLEDCQEIRKDDLTLTDSESSFPAQIVGCNEYMEESKPINDGGTLNFDSSNHGLSDCSSPSYFQDSSNIVNTLEDGQKMRNKDLVITRKRSNDSNVDHYERNDSIKRPFQEKEQGKSSTNGITMHEPVNQPTKCIKCGKLFSIADILRLSMENNCDQKSHKCNLCNRE